MSGVSCDAKVCSGPGWAAKEAVPGLYLLEGRISFLTARSEGLGASPPTEDGLQVTR